MKYLGFASVLAAITLLLAAVALGKEKDQGKLQLVDPVRIGSTQLQPGNYKVEWQGNGPSVNVTFLQGNRTVASTPGKVIELKSRPDDDAVVTATAKHGGVRRLEEIDFGNRTEALRIDPGMAAQANSTSGR